MANEPEKSAKRMQARSKELPEAEQPKEPKEQEIAITLRTQTGFEYHLVKPESFVRALIDPDIPDAFIELPPHTSSVKHHFLHTSQVAELDIHSEMEF